MFYNVGRCIVESIKRLQKLSALMGLEPAEDIGCPNIAPLQTEDIYITNAATPNGKHLHVRVIAITVHFVLGVIITEQD
jgi:hypothetical protein